MEAWLNYLREAKKTCFIEGGMKKVHYTFPDGKEMAEEYNMDTQLVVRRAWRIKRTFAGDAEWEMEIGDFVPVSANPLNNLGIQEATSQPLLSKRITRVNIEWRIRNLPYPIETYTVIGDNEERCITIKTSNKKFFKKLPMPDFDRLKLPIEQSRISVSHKYNTLIICYKKPAELTTLDKLVMEEVNKIPTPKSNNVQCPTS